MRLLKPNPTALLVLAAGCVPDLAVTSDDESAAGDPNGDNGQVETRPTARPDAGASLDRASDVLTAGARGDAGAGSTSDAGITGPGGAGPESSSEIAVTPGRGFYTAPLAVVIAATRPGAAIRYTTDGSPPSATSGLDYAGPIAVKGTTVLRAALFEDGKLVSRTETHTYIFLDDVIRQSPNGETPPGWPSKWGANVVDYGMDPDIVNHPRYAGTIKDDLKSIPTLSLVMRLKDLFDPATGIYANAIQSGRPWERPGSLELIYPDGRKGFQVNAGVRIRGGFSRQSTNPKHSFHLFFRAEYGDAKLRYPLFGEGGAAVFDRIDIRSDQNNNWSFQPTTHAVFLRDQFSRDTLLAMGQQAERGNYYHLYINGQYWGLYDICERPGAEYGATYFGGKDADYDSVKVDNSQYVIVAGDGDLMAWTRLYNLAKAGLGSDAAYQRVQGNDPSGTRNLAFENLLDVTNLIDYMLLILYTGNVDGPVSLPLGNQSPNNFFALRDRTGPNGFRFVAHDCESTLLGVNDDRNGPFPAGDQSVSKSNPQWIWQKLQSNAEFRSRVADRVQRHFFNGGALTVAAALSRLKARQKEIDRAIVGESARWGDAKRASPFTRDESWLPAVTALINDYFPRRSDIVLAQLKARGLYSPVVAPSLNQHGGTVARGFAVTITAPTGVVYYTLDGSDPRLPGGGVSPTARPYSSGVTLTTKVVLKARALSDQGWSALDEAAFSVAP